MSTQSKTITGWSDKGWEKYMDEDSCVELLGAFTIKKPRYKWVKNLVAVSITVTEQEKPPDHAEPGGV